MTLSYYGKAIHFYMWFGNFLNKVKNILILLLILSGALVIYVPQFSLHKEGFKISLYIPLAIIQVIVGIVFLISLVGVPSFITLLLLFALHEVFIELLLRKKVYKLIKEKQRMSLDELVKATGVLEDELSLLLKSWILKPGEDTGKIYKSIGTIKSCHLQFDLNTKELCWKE